MSIDTVNDLPPRVQYVAAAAQTVFPYPFPIFQDADLAVEVNSALKTLTEEYTVSDAGEDVGGNVTFVTGLSAGDIVTIYRQTVIERDSDFQLNGPMFSTSVNDEFDKLIVIAQELRAATKRCLRLPVSAEVDDVDIELTPIAAWANKYMAFDSTGKPEPAELVSGTISASIIGGLINPTTTAESAALLTQINHAFPQGDSRRYVTDNTGATDVTAQLQGMLNAAGLAASNGDVKEVVVYPGTYKVTRLYMRYSNVWLRLMPGAVIQQTRTGITDAATTGVAPAYAVIHVNPATYLHNPASGVAGTIENVRIYGGGTVKGPYTTTGTYDGFSMGVAGNDCHKCHVQGIKVMNCRAENILLGNSSWNTITDARIIDCEVTEGGEVGINNGRDFFILHNYVHNSWMMNGVGGNGDGGIVAFNRISDMALGGMTFGGSGARDINECRNVVVAYNTVHNCNQLNGGACAISLFDDGATTTAKRNIQVVGNIVTAHTGNLMVGCDYTTGNVVFANNIFSGITGSDATIWAVINNGATYHLKGNEFLLGTGNAARCVDVQSGAPVVILDEGNYYDSLIATSIQGVSDFTIRHQHSGDLTLDATGFTTAVQATTRFTAKQDAVTLYIPGFSGTSNTNACTLGTLPTYLRPARQQNFIRPVTDNGVNALALVSVATTGVISLFKDINGGAFTTSGTKGYSGPYPITFNRR